jgi:tyrosine-specific transport protein
MRGFSSIGIMVGMIVGAGMFALPYVVAQAGVQWGITHLVLTFFIILSIHLLYGEVVVGTPGKHRLPGYAAQYLGHHGKTVAFISAIIGFYGSMLTYGILGGIFLQKLLGDGIPLVVSTLFFFTLGAIILLRGIDQVGKINFFLTVPLLLLILLVCFLLFPHADIDPFSFGSMDNWFLPYGVFLFALSGASAIPDAIQLLKRKNKHEVRSTIFWGTFIPAVLYALFVFAVLGVTGAFTTQDAISGLEAYVGTGILAVGALVGFLAVFTSFLAMGLDLKNLIRYDYRKPEPLAWALTVGVPIVLYFLGITDFVRVMAFIGTVAIGTDGLLIIISYLCMCERKRVQPFAPGHIIAVIVLLGLLVGVAYELGGIFIY